MNKKLNYTIKFCFLFLLIAVLVYKYYFFISDIHSVLSFYKEFSFLVLIPFLLIVFLDNLPAVIIQSVTFILNIILMIVETLIEWFAEVAPFIGHAEDFTTPLSTFFLVCLNVVIMIFKIANFFIKKKKE